MEHVVLCTRSAPAPFGGSAPVVPLATRTLAAHLQRHLPPGAARVTVVDFPSAATAEEMLRSLEALAPDVVGLSCYVWNCAAHFELCDLLRERAPGVAVVLGGPHVDYDAEDLARLRAHHPGVGLLVQGEGERALLRYLRTPRPERPGAGAVVRGQALETFDPMDAPLCVLYPPLAGVDTLEVETQRGCTFRCSFCYAPTGGRALRRRERAHVEAELGWAVAHAIPNVGYANAGLNLDAEHLRSVVAAATAADPGRTLHHSAEVDYRRLKRADVAELARLRIRVGVGFQSVGDEANRLMHRRFDAPAIRRAVEWLRDAGADVKLEFIIGLPGDTLDDVLRTIDFAVSLQCITMGSILRVLPGTELYARRRDFGLVYDEADGHLLRSSPWLSADDLARACAEYGQRAEAAAVGGGEARARLWGGNGVDLSRASRRAAAEHDLRVRVDRFLARYPGLQLDGTELESWQEASVLVCRLRLRNGEAFRLGFAPADARVESLFEAEGCRVTSVSADGVAPSPTVRQALETMQRRARPAAGRGAGSQGRRS